MPSMRRDISFTTPLGVLGAGPGTESVVFERDRKVDLEGSILEPAANFKAAPKRTGVVRMERESG